MLQFYFVKFCHRSKTDRSDAVVVVVRKQFLKTQTVEIMPEVGEEPDLLATT